MHMFMSLQWTMMVICFVSVPYLFSATQTKSPLLEISTVKVMTLSLLNLGQDVQESGVVQLYTGSGNDDALQFSTTSSLTFTFTILFCGKYNSGGPKVMNTIINAYA